jgi:hypothetical protein
MRIMFALKLFPWIVVTVGWGWSGLPYLGRKRAKRARKEVRLRAKRAGKEGGVEEERKPAGRERPLEQGLEGRGGEKGKGEGEKEGECDGD